MSLLRCSYSNLVLTDKEQRIVSCARQISSRMSSKRLLQTGSQYAFPPPQFSVPPSASETCAVWQLNLRGADTQQLGQTGAPLVLAAAMAQAYQVRTPAQCQRKICSLIVDRTNLKAGMYADRLVSACLQGMSPMTARQVCLKAGVNSSLPLRMVTDEQWKALHSAWNAWIVAVQTRSFTVTQSSAGDGQFLTIGAFGVPAPGGVLEAVDSYYRMPQVRHTLRPLQHTPPLSRDATPSCAPAVPWVLLSPFLAAHEALPERGMCEVVGFGCRSRMALPSCTRPSAARWTEP